jgi:branched-subunit amino acid aminotransferase/4-amino-4-deoxychorismate lyase
VRLTLTRGEKLTSGMSPTNNCSGCTLIVLAEWKPPVWGARALRLCGSSVRRNPPQCLPSRIHHANLLNNILAKLEAEAAGMDEAIMLDVEGFVAETNATNLFLVKDGALATPTGEHCLPGITRGVVLELARAHGLPTAERRLSLAEFHVADEVFCTGTMGELAPVAEIDGRPIGTTRDGDGESGGAHPGSLTHRLQGLFRQLVAEQKEPLPI